MSKKDSSVAIPTQRKPGRPRKVVGKAEQTIVSVDPVVLDTYGRTELHKKAEKLFGKPKKAADNMQKLIDEYDERINAIMDEITKLEEVKNQLSDERNVIDNLMSEMIQLGVEFEYSIRGEASN